MAKKDIDPRAAEFGQRLKEARVRSGKTQADVAAIFGKKPQAVGHWETGTNAPTAPQLAILAETYGADPAGLLYGKDLPASIKLRPIGDSRAQTLALEFASLPEQLAGKTKDALLGELLKALLDARHNAPATASPTSGRPTPEPAPAQRTQPGATRVRQAAR